jgi:DNA polymerase-1
MTLSLPADLAIHSDGKHLILPLQLDQREIDSIVRRKSQLLASLRSSQMDEAGFYTTLPRSLHEELQAAAWLTLDIQTTAPTRYSKPDRISGDSCIGPGTWMTYRAAHPGASLNTRPRIRVLSLYTNELGSCAWDLDALNQDDRQLLFSAALHNKTVIGHDAGVALSWLFTETAARPAYVLDSMLLMRQLRPQALLRPFAMAVDHDREVRARLKNLIEREEGAPSGSLEWIATSLHLPIPKHPYQHHTSWCVSDLSAEHRVYANEIIGLPLAIVKFLVPGVDVRDIANGIIAKHPWYVPFATATIRLAESHARGVPFDVEASDALRAECLKDIVSAADELAQFSQFASLREQLCNPQAGESAELKTAVAKYAIANGVALPQGASLATTPHAGRTSGADILPGWKLLETIKKKKAGYGSAGRYANAALRDGRMHSLITFAAATGRAKSCEPALQNVPRDPLFRALIKARPGHLILAADYAAIELRIAAVLAERAVSNLRQRVATSNEPDWFLELVADGLRAPERLHCPPEPSVWTLDWLNAAIPAVAQTVLRRDVQMMLSIFDRDLDPHVVTALDMARRQGKVDCGPDPIEWLAGRDKQTRNETKLALRGERQQAKSANFGLLYGMSGAGLHAYGINNYGLSWTTEEAAQARQAWFALYPEFRLWHFWTKYAQSRKLPLGGCAVWNSYEGKLIRPSNQPRFYETSTLSNRPLAILDDFGQALSFQGQGTGADILASAIASLPEAVSQMLLIPVHDELVFEASATEIDEVRQIVVETMTRAADMVLGGKVPIEVEPVIGETWGKA